MYDRNKSLLFGHLLNNLFTAIAINVGIKNALVSQTPYYVNFSRANERKMCNELGSCSKNTGGGRKAASLCYSFYPSFGLCSKRLITFF